MFFSHSDSEEELDYEEDDIDVDLDGDIDVETMKMAARGDLKVDDTTDEDEINDVKDETMEEQKEDGEPEKKKPRTSENDDKDKKHHGTYFRNILWDLHARFGNSELRPPRSPVKFYSFIFTPDPA